MASEREMNRDLSFDAFEIDTRASEIRRAGERIELAPAAVRTLHALAERSGELVTREELYAHLWPDGGVDTERLLNTYVRQIRTALGERGGDDRFIRTYPRRGYRFLRPVHRGLLQPQSTKPPSRTRRTIGFVTLAGMLGAAIVAVLPSRPPVEVAVNTQLPVGEEARIEYLTGMQLLGNALPNIRATAAAHFRQTTELEPEFAAAFSGLAESLMWANETTAARRAAESALARDSLDGRAHMVFGHTLLTSEWDWTAAEQHLRTSRLLSPNTPAAGIALSFLLTSAGRHAEARDVLDEVVRLEPVSPVVTGDLGLLYGWLGDHETALELCQRTTQIEPRAIWGHTCALSAAEALGNTSDVALESEAIVESAGADPSSVFSPFDGTKERIGELRQFQLSRIDQATNHFGQARLWAAVGNSQNALSALEQAATDHEMGFVAILAEPAFRPLRAEPRFKALVGQLFATSHPPQY